MGAPVAPTPSPGRALSTDNLMRHAMSAGIKTIPNQAPAAPTLSAPSTPPASLSTALDKSTTMPPAPNTLRFGELAQQRAREGAPLDPNDPKYKMGIGGKILGAVANALTGFASRGTAPTRYVGPGATNARYERDTEQQQKNLSNLDTELANTEKLDKSNESLYRSAITQAHNAQMAQVGEEKATALKEAADAKKQLVDLQGNTIDPNSLRYDADSGKWYGTPKGGGDEREVTPKGFQKPSQNPKTYEEIVVAAKLEKDPVRKKALQAAAADIKDTEVKKFNYAPNRPRQFTARDELRLNAKAKELGKGVEDLSDQEINQALSVASTNRPAHAKDRQTFEEHWGKRFLNEVEKPYQKARDAVMKQYGVDKDASKYGSNKDDIEADLAAPSAAREQAKAKLQAEKDAEAEQYGVCGKNTPAATQPPAAAQPSQPFYPTMQPSAPAPATQPARPSAAPQRKVGDIVSTRNGNMKITKILPGGKYEGVPAQAVQ
jgi:hypothetical protein